MLNGENTLFNVTKKETTWCSILTGRVRGLVSVRKHSTISRTKLLIINGKLRMMVVNLGQLCGRFTIQGRSILKTKEVKMPNTKEIGLN